LDWKNSEEQVKEPKKSQTVKDIKKPKESGELKELETSQTVKNIKKPKESRELNSMNHEEFALIPKRRIS
jgi:hypothetical protein